MILFADSQKLVESANIREAAFKSGADAVNQLMQGFSKAYPGYRLTFLIALTKCDAVDSKWKGDDLTYQPLVERGRKAFLSLEQILKREASWRGGIIPISTMGEGTVDASGQIVKFISPLHIEHAMAYCISGVLRAEQFDTLQELVRRGVEITTIENRYRGFVGALRRIFGDGSKTSTDMELLEQWRKQSAEELQRLSTIELPLQRLADVATRKVRIIT